MMHAIAIGREGPVATAAIDRLWAAGYHSIFRVDALREMEPLLACVRPELILVLPDSSARESIDALRAIGAAADAPVVVATHDANHALDCLGPATPFEHAVLSPSEQEGRLALAA